MGSGGHFKTGWVFFFGRQVNFSQRGENVHFFNEILHKTNWLIFLETDLFLPNIGHFKNLTLVLIYFSHGMQQHHWTLVNWRKIVHTHAYTSAIILSYTDKSSPPPHTHTNTHKMFAGNGLTLALLEQHCRNVSSEHRSQAGCMQVLLCWCQQ